MQAVKAITEFLVGECGHDDYTWPLAKHHDGRKINYVACLQCGEELLYDMENMRVTGHLNAVD